MLILFFYSILINHIFNLTNKNWVPWCTSVNSLTKPVFNVSTETNNFQEKLVRHKCVITQTYSVMCDGSFHMHFVHLGTVNAICSEYSQRNWSTLQSNLCSFLYNYNWKIYRLSFKCHLSAPWFICFSETKCWQDSSFSQTCHTSCKILDTLPCNCHVTVLHSTTNYTKAGYFSNICCHV